MAPPTVNPNLRITNQNHKVIEDGEYEEVVARPRMSGRRLTGYALLASIGLVVFGAILSPAEPIQPIDRTAQAEPTPTAESTSTVATATPPAAYMDNETQLAANLQERTRPSAIDNASEEVCNQIELQAGLEDVFLKNFVLKNALLGDFTMEGANVRFTSIAKPVSQSYRDPVIDLTCTGSIAVDSVAVDGGTINIEIPSITWNYKIDTNKQETLTSYNLTQQQINNMEVVAPNGNRIKFAEITAY
jgi:hypothetical protein